MKKLARKCLVSIGFSSALIVFVFQPSVFAQADSAADHLVQEFWSAYKSRDETRFQKARDKLTADAKVLKYMEEKYPGYYDLYKLQDLSDRLHDRQGTTRGAFTAVEREVREREPRSSSQARQRTNADSQPNRNRTPNNELIRHSTNQDRLRQNRAGNSQRVRRSPNQDRPPNQARVR